MALLLYMPDFEESPTYVDHSKDPDIYRKRATQIQFEIHHESVTKLYNDLGSGVVDKYFLEVLMDGTRSLRVVGAVPTQTFGMYAGRAIRRWAWVNLICIGGGCCAGTRVQPVLSLTALTSSPTSRSRFSMLMSRLRMSCISALVKSTKAVVGAR